jgi:hypothetical protein
VPYNKYSNLEGYLLPGYPEDIWPLYESLAIDSCSFEVQTPAYNNTGRYYNSFSIIYVTEESKEEIAEFYLSLLVSPEESSFYDAIGAIQGYQVDARVDEQTGYNNVYLSVLLPENSPITSNPLLEDFPDEDFPLLQVNQIWREDCWVNSNQQGQLWKSKMFSHNATGTEALEYYRALLGDAEGYTEEKRSDQQVVLKGFAKGYNFIITIGVWNKPEMINITVWLPI